jgi:hypothetical protein
MGGKWEEIGDEECRDIFVISGAPRRVNALSASILGKT